MYGTQHQTNGLRCGFDERKPPQARCYADGILPSRQGCNTSLTNRSARTWRQPGTGRVKTYHSNDNEDSTPLATLKRWFCGAVAVLTFTGILPTALAGVLIWFTETFNLPWLPFVLMGLELWFIVRMVGR